jgi:hypothetical protein
MESFNLQGTSQRAPYLHSVIIIIIIIILA